MKDNNQDIFIEWNILVVSYYSNYSNYNQFIKNKQNNQNQKQNTQKQNNQINELKNNINIKNRKKDYFLLDLDYYVIKNTTNQTSNTNFIIKNKDFDLRNETLNNLAYKTFPIIKEYSLDFKSSFIYKENNIVVITLIFDKTLNDNFDKILKSICQEFNYYNQYSKKLFVSYKNSILPTKSKSILLKKKKINQKNNQKINQKKTSSLKYNIIKGVLECHLNLDYLTSSIEISKSHNLKLKLDNILKNIKPYFWINKLE